MAEGQAALQRIQPKLGELSREVLAQSGRAPAKKRAGRAGPPVKRDGLT